MSRMASIKVSQDTFGTIENPDTKKVDTVKRYTLENENGISIQIIEYGATITSLKVPSRDGKLSDIVLGYDDVSGYRSPTNKYFGACIGRVANRIGKGRFTIDGQEYQVPINNGPNSLHGGFYGFDKKMWQSKVIHEEGSGPKLVFSLLSPDGDYGYPGDLLSQVTYQLTPDNQLRYDFQAMTTKTTPIALTNHSYFNLSGHENADKKLKGHFIQLNADNYTPLDENLVTKGQISPVSGTVYDLRKQTDLGDILSKFPAGPNGYDNNFCLNPSATSCPIRLAARVQDVASGRVLEVHTDQPGVQFYTGNFLPDADEKKEPIVGKGGAKYWKHGGFCMETQNYPNAVNHV